MASPPKKPQTVKLILRLVITAAILGAAGWGGRVLWKQIGPGLFGTKREAKIPTAAVRVSNIAEEIVAVGRLRAVFSTELRAEISGRIMKISVIDGEAVKRDQEILRLDQQDILTQLQESDRNIEASKLKVGRAKREFERQKDLKTRELITTKDFEETRTTLSLTENDAAVYDARAANLRDKLAKTVIRAPHDGTLLLRDLTEGQLVTSAAATNGGFLPTTTPDKPYLSDYLFRDFPRQTRRTSAGATIDYKLGTTDRLSLSVQGASFAGDYSSRDLTFSVNRVLVGNFGPTYTHGFAGGGSVSMANADRDQDSANLSATSFMTSAGSRRFPLASLARIPKN